MAINMQTRHEAVRLLKEGVTIIVFPAGGVATAKKGFGRAEDLPWKIFPAKLIQAAKASVIPIYFEGQNGRLFHLASRVSLTLRISLLIREFRRLSGSTITSHIGERHVLGNAERRAPTARTFCRGFTAPCSRWRHAKRPLLRRAAKSERGHELAAPHQSMLVPSSPAGNGCWVCGMAARPGDVRVGSVRRCLLR